MPRMLPKTMSHTELRFESVSSTVVPGIRRKICQEWLSFTARLAEGIDSEDLHWVAQGPQLAFCLHGCDSGTILPSENGFICNFWPIQYLLYRPTHGAVRPNFKPCVHKSCGLLPSTLLTGTVLIKRLYCPREIDQGNQVLNSILGSHSTMLNQVTSHRRKYFYAFVGLLR